MGLISNTAMYGSPLFGVRLNPVPLLSAAKAIAKVPFIPFTPLVPLVPLNPWNRTHRPAKSVTTGVNGVLLTRNEMNGSALDGARLKLVPFASEA